MHNEEYHHVDDIPIQTIKTLSGGWMENRMMESRCTQVVAGKIFFGNEGGSKMFYFKPGIGTKDIYYLFASLIA